MKYVIDERDAFIPGFDLQGKLLPEEVRESLRTDLLKSNLDSDEEIRAFVHLWLARIPEEHPLSA
jgi:hypothetical protein